MSFRIRLLTVMVGVGLLLCIAPRASEAVHLLVTRGTIDDEGADVLVVKTGPTSSAADTDVEFDVSVMNVGPDDSAQVTLTDKVPAGMTFVSANQESGPSFDCSGTTATPGSSTGSVICTIATLANTASADFKIIMHIPPATPPATSFTNTAIVTSNGPPGDPNGENDVSSAIVTTPGPDQADLVVSKTGPSATGPDSDVSFVINVTNAGPNTAQNVALNDTLPGNMTFVSIVQNSGPAFSCSFSLGTVTCSILSLNPAQTASFTLTGHIPAGTPSGTTYSNQAIVSSDTADPDPDSNRSTAIVTVSSSDLAITKTGPPSVTAGNTITWTITASMVAGDTANAVLNDQLPADTTFVSFTQDTGPTASCGTPQVGMSGFVSCTLLLAAGQSAQFTLVAATDPNAFGTITNTAIIGSSNFDPNEKNNSSTTNTPVINNNSNLSITKTDSPDPVVPGSNLTYTIGVTNNGPATATSVVVTDALPAAVSYVSATPTQGSCSGTTTVTCNLGSISNSNSASVVIVVQVNPGTPNNSTISNTAQVTADQDPDNSDNSFTTTTTVSNNANVGITKTDSPDPVTPGSSLTYAINVSNAGPTPATNVVVTDTLPAGVSFVSATPSQGSCSGTSTVTCNLGSIGSGNSATVNIVVQVNSNQPINSSITNTAQVTADQDPDLSNNSSTATTTVADTPIPPFSGTNENLVGSLAISEFRADGPNGVSDEYVEVCNISTRTFTILADDPGRIRGIGVYSFIHNPSAPVFLFSIPDGTVFQPGQCFLGAGQTFSLAGPGGAASAPGLPGTFGNSPYSGATVDALFDPDRSGTVTPGDVDAIQSDTGVAVFGTDNARFGFNTSNQPVALKNGTTIPTAIVDAVGFDITPTVQFPGTEGPLAKLFREGTGLKPIGIRTNQYAFVRRYCAPASAPCVGRPDNDTTDQQMRDVNDNTPDFYGSTPVAPTSTQAAPVTFTVSGLATTAMLGAPGPEGYTGTIISPIAPTNTQPSGSVVGAPSRRRFNAAVATLNLSTVSFDTTAGTAFGIPNRERVSAVPRPGTTVTGETIVPADNNEASAPKGTFAFRFTLRNQTGQTITRLRFRLVDASTDNRGVIQDAFTGSAIPATTANQAILRWISSTTARVFVTSGADQNCTYASPVPAGQTACGGAGYKLVQGLVLEPTQPQGTSAGNVGGANTIPPGAPLGNGVNAGAVIENNTLAGSGAGAFPNNAGSGNSAGNPNRSSGLPRGRGTIILATPLANGDAISIEFRFGVQQNGRFYLQIVPEADGAASPPPG